MRLGVALAAASTAFLALWAAAPPPGATARCVDGTFSFSTHHSGTCSHHGGVAAWLDAGAAPSAPAATVPVGTTVVLGPRTKSSGCRLGAVPDRACSPGAYYSGLTKAVICAAGFHTGSVRSVSQATKYAVEREYGLQARLYGRTLEIDHIVPLELGGSNAIANLFPERAYQRKDVLENRLHALVCAGRMDLRATQRAIAADWRALYRRLYG